MDLLQKIQQNYSSSEEDEDE